MKPYCPPEKIQGFGVSNYQKTKYLVDNQSLDEASCTLLFLKNQTCVAYSVIPRSTVDLTDLTNEKDSGISLITKANCVKKLRFGKSSTFVKMID
ncbi:hypothetical protein QMK33_03740 [Hymenobacter sp. H14-R3]|uniref:hypothetical protein n=1 Tax=Hymenobacter sp. H14-R3 TaxID=3046308 RepID=UPI0024BA1CEF|nr:hypothetical protein [Hymenobacter sp. H14-R3]MDJ0364249.1 hypothetical protein [Hymenobacter sp. H14-R3]